MTREKLLIALSTLSVLGFLDALYLTITHYTRGPLVCIIESSCDVVTTSTYSTIGPIPAALLGLLYYLIVFILSIYLLKKRSKYVLFLVTTILTLGVLGYFWFIYVQLAILEAICIYCLFSALVTFIAFCISGELFWRER